MVIAVAGVLVVASLLLAAWPTTPASPLIPKTGWKIDGHAFANVQPQTFELPESMVRSPESIYWRTWSPKTGATKATITTDGFRPSRYMAIPYGGFAGDPGISLDLRCVSTDAVLPIATARTNNQMTAAMIRVPDDWCAGNVIVKAKSRNMEKYVEVGTPFSISGIDYYKNSFLGLVGLFAVVLAFTIALALVPDGALILVGSKRTCSPLAGLALVGLVGYAMFFVLFFSRATGHALSCVILGGTIALFAWTSIRRPAALRELWTRRRVPIVLWAAVAFTAYALAMSTYNGAGPWSINALFTPVRWSTDNQFPAQISEYLFQGIDPRKLPYGVWHISDRPPLAYGLMAMLRTISWIIASHSDGFALYFQYALIGGIVINSLWIVAVYYLLASLGMTRREIYFASVVLALTGFAIFNTLYIWPKMLGGAFGLIAFAMLFEPERRLGTVKYEPYGNALLWAALFSGLALESHGGTAFGIIAAILVATWYRGLPTLRLGFYAVLVGLAILAPWALWQHYEQPPGDALIKYAFSGHYGFEYPNESLFQTVAHAYSQLTVGSWIEMKLRALRMIFTTEATGCALAEVAPISSLYGLSRVQDFFHLVPSLRFLAIGFLPLLLTRECLGTGTSSKLLHYARAMVGTGFLSVGMYSLFAFHCYINHMQAYQSIMEIMIGLVICLVGNARWYYKLCLILSMLYGTLVWVVDPIVSAEYVRWGAVTCTCVVAASICWGLSRRSRVGVQ